VSEERDGKIQNNRHLAAHLRKQLECRHENGTRARDMLNRLSDEDLVATYLRNEKQGRDHSARRREEKKGIA
jgi:hypothetical protein